MNLANQASTLHHIFIKVVSQSSSSSVPLSQPSSYDSAISPRELLSASRSSIPTARLTICCRFLSRIATVVSVDKDVLTDKDVADLACANMWGKLSRSGNGRVVQDLQAPRWSVIRTSKEQDKGTQIAKIMCGVGSVEYEVEQNLIE